jgi:hypothetical protein
MAPGAREVRLIAADGRCVAGPPEHEEPMILAECGDSRAQVIRL